MQTVSFSAGTDIEEAARLLAENAPARGDFNGITLTATKGASAEAIVSDYHALSERRHREWLRSPEGRRQARRSQMEVENLQAKADRLMARLPALDFGNVAELLDWLAEMAGPRNRNGVRVDVKSLIAAFRAHGYEPGANVYENFDESDPENFARWVIGQAIEERCHPSVGRFVGDWRKKFGAAKA